MYSLRYNKKQRTHPLTRPTLYIVAEMVVSILVCHTRPSCSGFAVYTTASPLLCTVSSAYNISAIVLCTENLILVPRFLELNGAGLVDQLATLDGTCTLTGAAIVYFIAMTSSVGGACMTNNIIIIIQIVV